MDTDLFRGQIRTIAAEIAVYNILLPFPHLGTDKNKESVVLIAYFRK